MGWCHLDVVMTDGFAVIYQVICTSTKHLLYPDMDILLRCLVWKHLTIFRFSFSSNKVRSFPLHTYSEGCAGAIKRILGKMDGVTNVETNVEEKSVKVTADEGVTAEQCAEKLAKWSAASGKYVKVP